MQGGIVARAPGARVFALAMAATVFFGISLGGPVAEGGSGRLPMQNGLAVRPNVADLSHEQRVALVDAILALKETPAPIEGYESYSYYDMFVKWHRDVFFCGRRQSAHMGANFLPWHRQYLLMFEQALNEVSDTPIVLPYWDWTDPASTNGLFRKDLMGGNGNPAQEYAVTSGRFEKGEWRLNVLDQRVSDPNPERYLTRRIGSFPDIPQLPTAEDVQQALTRPVYDTVPFDDEANPAQSFRNNLEGWRGKIGEDCEDGLFGPLTGIGVHEPSAMHNSVHLWVGGLYGKGKNQQTGTMTLNTSPNDPIFWLHHANIDRLWESWMAINGRVYEPTGGWPRPGQNLNNRMVPVQDLRGGRDPGRHARPGPARVPVRRADPDRAQRRP